MDQKCKDCGCPIMSWRCECPSNIMNQPNPARDEALRLMQNARPFASSKGADRHG